MRIIALIVICSLAPTISAQPVIHGPTEPVSQCLDFEKHSYALTGALFKRIYFGSPNYGENPAADGRETAALLLLDAPICVRENRAAFAYAEFNVVLIQLAALSIPPDMVFNAVGHRVEVRGSLFHSMTAHHRTTVLVDVSEVKILD